MIKQSLLPPPPPLPPKNAIVYKHPTKLRGRDFHIDFNPKKLPNKIKASFNVDFERHKLPDKLKPSFHLDIEHKKNEYSKILGGDSHTQHARENPLYYEMGLKGMTEKDLYIQRLQNENGVETPLQARLNAKENETTPSDEFLKLYNARKVKDGDEIEPVDLGASKIVIAPAFEEKDEEVDEDEDVKKIVSKYIDEEKIFEGLSPEETDILSRFSSPDETVSKKVTAPEIKQIFDSLKLYYNHRDKKPALVEHLKQFLKGVNKGIEDPDKMPFVERRDLYEDKNKKV